MRRYGNGVEAGLENITLPAIAGLLVRQSWRRLREGQFPGLITRTSAELDLRRQADAERFFEKERPEFVFMAAAKVGGILANNTYRADFIYDNTMIAANAIHSSEMRGEETPQSRLIVHLSETLTAAHEGGLSAHRSP